MEANRLKKGPICHIWPRKGKPGNTGPEQQGPGLPGTCNWKRPNSVFKKAKFWILLNKLLGKKGQILNKPRLEKGQILNKFSQIWRSTVWKKAQFHIWPRKGKPGNPGPEQQGQPGARREVSNRNEGYLCLCAKRQPIRVVCTIGAVQRWALVLRNEKCYYLGGKLTWGYKTRPESETIDWMFCRQCVATTDPCDTLMTQDTVYSFRIWPRNELFNFIVRLAWM